jgi:hypothetical protein
MLAGLRLGAIEIATPRSPVPRGSDRHGIKRGRGEVLSRHRPSAESVDLPQGVRVAYDWEL